MKRIVVGVDPGTGISSPTGLAIFDPDTRSLLHTARLTSEHESDARRIKDISSQLTERLAAIDPALEVFVFIESFVMRGRAGEKLARLTGALMAACPFEHEVAFVHNTTVKLQIAGHGHAKKDAVAKGVYQLVHENKESRSDVRELIAAEQWDIIDAFAIGLAGWKRKTEAPSVPKKPARRRKKAATNPS